MRVVEGKLPDMVNLRNAESWRPPPIEAVIGVRAAAQSGYRIGGQLTASSQYHRLDIVGIVEPINPHADIWSEDLRAFAPVTTTLPLIIDSYSMESFYPFRPIFPHEVSWRVTLNPQLVTANDAETLHSNLLNLQTQFATVHAVIETGLAKILADYLAQLSRLRTVLLLLTTQNLMVVLYALAIFASFVADRSRAELAMLSGRGASAWQIIRDFVLEDFVLSLTAVILGPVLVMGTMRLWAESTDGTSPIAMPTEAWVLAGVVALLSSMLLILAILLSAQRNILGEHRLGMQIPQPSMMQKRYIDLYLLAFGALLYWQLNQTDSFVMSRLRNTFLADPLLLIGPSLLLIGVAMVLLRVLPFLLYMVARLAQNLRGLALSQGLHHLTRDSQHSSQVILLVSMTSGLVLFAQILGNSLMNSPEPVVCYLAGALQLNALALVLFSVTIFFLMYLFATQERAREFGILSAMGLSFRQWLISLMMEGVLVLFLGLMTGTVVGLGLSNIMIPYLAQALTGWQIGAAIEHASVNWTVIAQSCVLLIAVYGLALVLLWAVLMRTREHWTVSIEEE
jgi:hypothetical protein